jgi:menaquinone-dependent protoporphyrinogen oxidase
MTDKSPSKTHVLVSAGSKHGSTAEIAARIQKALVERGLETTVAEPSQVTEIAGYDAIVLGSAVYAGHWLPAATALAYLVAAASPRPLTWLFSSGPIGDPPKPDEDPVDIAEVMQVTAAREHRLFAGKIDKSKLSFGEKAIVVALRVPEGDFRDWDEIDAWAADIATALPRIGVGSGSLASTESA